jgi:hypothetical protein
MVFFSFSDKNVKIDLASADYERNDVYVSLSLGGKRFSFYCY